MIEGLPCGRPWYESRTNLATLVRWALAEGYAAEEVIGMLREPWNWRAEFVAAYCRGADAREPQPREMAGGTIAPAGTVDAIADAVKRQTL